MTPKKSSTPKKAKAPKDSTARTLGPAAPKRAPRKKAAGLRVFIDYPREGEIVKPGHYTVRIGTVPAAATVEVSVDGGVWAPCREAAGYWWYDWSGFEAGPHHLHIRAQGESPVPAAAERYVNVSIESASTA